MKTIPTSLLLPALVLASSLAPAIAAGQASSNVTVVASGLAAPRGLKFGPDGLLYVAEAGSGGSTSTVGICPQVPPPIGPYMGGTTGRISRIDASGNRITVASGFPSALDGTGGVVGVADLTFLGGTLYALVAGGGCSHGSVNVPASIVKVDVKTGSWTQFANLSAFVHANPVKYANADDYEPDGDYYSMIGFNGRLYVVEANQGQVLSVGADGVVRREIDVSASEGHIVPTSIAEHYGQLVLGNLNVFPSTLNTATIKTLAKQSSYDSFPGLGFGYRNDRYRISSSTAGFTEIVGTAFGPDGLLYVLELSAQSGYPAGGAGKVVRIQQDGTIEDIATGLVVPTGMTFSPDGELYVSNFGAAPAGAGKIVRVILP